MHELKDSGQELTLAHVPTSFFFFLKDMCRPDHNHYSIHDHSSIASPTVTSTLVFKGVIFVESTSTTKEWVIVLTALQC